MDNVVQFGTEMMPFGRTLAASGLISGTTSGTSGSIRNAPDLSITTTPRAAATGAHSADTSSGTSNMARSTPSNTLWRQRLHDDVLAADLQPAAS